jgi:hypothetical protein
MKTDGGWVSISEAARLYGKSRKWVSNQISTYDIETQKEGNQTRFRLVDLIAHRGEPQGDGTTPTASPTQKSQKVAPEVAQNLNLETELLKQENVFLRRRIEELEVDRADWKTERSKLQSIIERQLALPSPERRGWFARLVDWARN